MELLGGHMWLDEVYWHLLSIEDKIHSFWMRILVRVYRLFGKVHHYEVWNLDIEIARFIAPRIRMLAETGHGYPCFAPDPEQWTKYLNEIAEDLERYEQQDPYDDDLGEVGKRAMRKLAESFPALWD